jgi:hypothetical protein
MTSCTAPDGGRRQPDRAARLELAVARDGQDCFWCGRRLGGLVRATTDHVVPKVKGGPSWLENEVAACRRCNGERGHAGPVEWLEECRRRGWPADPEALARVLDGLDAAILARGGLRRARPYVAAQLRRLARRGAGPGRAGAA